MKALKILRDLDLTARLQQYPQVPRRAFAGRRFSDRTANLLTASILRWLQLHNHYATRINTMGRKLKDTAIVNVIGQRVIPGKWIPGTTKRGTADIHAVINGRHCSIEIKIGFDRMSKHQEQTKQEVEQSGGLYFIAKDFDSFHKFYNQITSE